MDITTVGIDIAKNVFQVHAMNERGKTVLRKRISRSDFLAFFVNLPQCLIAMQERRQESMASRLGRASWF